jgi:hypothetical protein
MIDLGGFYCPMEVDNELSATLSTETLTDRDIVTLASITLRVRQQTPLHTEIFEHWRFLGLRYSFYTCNARRVRESL